MALLHVRWGGSATGVLITDKCHGPAGDGAIVATQCSMRWSILNTYQQKARPAGWVPGAGRESITRHAGLREALPAAIAPNASHREQKDADRATRKDQRGGNAQHVHPVGPSHGRKRRGRPYSCPWWADEQVFALAFMQGNGGEIPRDPGIRTRGARTRDPR
jgi:hypothetical protein